MKKLSIILVVLTAAMLMACGSSKTEAENPQAAGETSEVSASKQTAAAKQTETTRFETQPYSIPEGASGPADVKIENNEDLPDDKKSEETTGRIIQVRYYYINSKGLNEEFDVIENGECDAGALNDLMIRCGVLADGTEILSFESDGTNATLELNEMAGQSSYATEELLSQAIANVYTDNLGLDTLTIKVGDKTYGPLEYDSGKKKQ